MGLVQYNNDNTIFYNTPANNNLVWNTTVSSPIEPLLLDTYPGAYMAFSVRLLSNSYSGYCMRVKRSSDNTSQDFGFVNGLLDTASILSFVGSGNGLVTTWYDQSGNLRNAGTAIGTPPFIVQSGVLSTLSNGKASYKSNGTNGMGFALASSISQPNTYFLVTQSNTSASISDGSSPRQMIWTSGSNKAIYGGSTLNIGVSSASVQILYALFNSTNSAGAVNGGSLLTGNAGANGIGTTYIGYYRTTAPSITGGTQEYIVYPSNMSSNRTAIRDNQNAYFTVY